MSRTIILALVWLMGVGPQGSAAEFTVATYNINWGNVNLRETVSVIRKANADLVALQETNAESERVLRTALRREYGHMVFRGDRGRYGAERFGFLSKTPIANLRYLPAKHGMFGTWIGKSQLGGKRVQLVNVHLQPAFPDKGTGLTALMDMFNRVEETHTKEIASIWDGIQRDVPTLILGDFNSLSLTAAPKFLVDKAMVDSFASVTKDADTHRTWRWRVGQGELSARIDYVFHSKAIETVESRIVPTDASDHFLVSSRLRWKGEKADVDR